jgi:hypothetical protein
MSQVSIFLHVLGVVISLGTGIFFALIFYPSLKVLEDPNFHPLFLFGICLCFMTGAFQLTDLKLAFGTEYFTKLSSPLMWKFGMTLLIFLIASMQCFGMGLKLGRMVNGVIPGDLARQEYYAKKIWRAQFSNLIFLSMTLWMGLQLSATIHQG